MKPISPSIYLSLFLYFITLLMAGGLMPIYTPVDDITLNCGYSGNVSNSYFNDSRIWIGDINSKFSPFEEGQLGNTSQVREAPQSSSVSKVPYATARLSYYEFTYRFLLNSGGQKFIRLYFYDVSYTNFSRSKAFFSVKAGGYTLLNDFNAYVSEDSNGGKMLSREFCINVEEEQSSLNITFTPTPHAFAFINGIEIVSMPTNLYLTTPQSEGANYVGLAGNQTMFDIENIENSTALEMVYRLNVGGTSLPPIKDTGMYRNWDEDGIYLDNFSSLFSVLPANTSIELNFTNIPEYSAPKEVYQTGRSMGKYKDLNKRYNLTWELPVDPNFLYLLRLHFCEFEPEIQRFGDRTFRIHIANQTVEEWADVIGWSGGNGNPIYRNYVVFVSGAPGSQKTVNLVLALEGSEAFRQDSMTSYTDAILNGLEIFKLNNDSNGNLAPMAPRPPPKGLSSIPKKANHKSTLAITAGVMTSTLVLSVLVFLVFRRLLRSEHSCFGQWMKNSTTNAGKFLPDNLSRYFSLAEIKVATKNFNDAFIIGAGGFGNVYKGSIDGGATPVAIKRLKPESSQGVHEFKTEIELLSQLRHRHLVSLIGYCGDKGEMILVYDYMALGTLRDHLYNSNNPPIPWEQRLQICIGAARGLQYLHNGTKGTIIHRDVKSTNILLDDKWVAKVSDFGLSKGTTNASSTHISTVVKGSFGYLDPEYYRRQRLTEKSDVYSFGVVLCEVLCGRPAVINTEETRQVSLAEWAKSCHQNGELDQIIDPSLRGKIAAECLNRFTEVAISCIHDNGTERPSMNDIVRELELALQHQQRAEGDVNCIEGDNEIERSSSDHSSATNDSIKCISATIFSEINNPSGR